MSTKGGYKQLILKARELMGKAGLIAFDRAKLLCQIFEDRDFRADLGNADDFKCAETLDELCGDLSLKFLRLKQLVEHFPERKQWASGNLERMLAEMLASVTAPIEDHKPKRERTVIKQSEFVALSQEKTKVEQQANEFKKLAEVAKQEKVEIESKAREFRQAAESAEEKCRRLEIENRDLREKLAEANGRIAELTRMVRGLEPVAA